jgi:Tfp pilus assembly protein PilE
MEVVVVIAVLSLLAGLIVPAFRSVQQDGQAAKILAVVDSLRKACEKHYADTGQYAYEYTPSSATVYADPSAHLLSMTQTYAGWKGPYLDHPLTTADSPFNSTVYVYNTTANWASNGGFNLTGSAAGDTITGNGQLVVFYAIPEAVAERVNDALDKNIPGDWMVTGRVEYLNSYYLTVFLMNR